MLWRVADGRKEMFVNSTGLIVEVLVLSHDGCGFEKCNADDLKTASLKATGRRCRGM